MQLARILALLSLLSLCVSFGLQWNRPHVVQFSSEATNIAHAILDGRGFSDPYMTGPSGPTAQRAPIYPALYAAVCRIFGTGATGWAVIVFLTALAWALQWFYAYRFAELAGYARAGLMASILGCLIPLPGRLYKWEAVFAGLVLAASAMLLSRMLKGDVRTATSIEFGILLSIGVLLSPVLVLIWPFWCLHLAWRQSMKPAALAVIVALIPVGAWSVRNYAVLGHWFFIRDDAGMAFVSSNNDCATALITENIASGCFADGYPSGSPAMLKKMIAAGEYEFSQAEGVRTWAWIRSHPQRFLWLTLQRAAYFWFPFEGADRQSFWNGCMLAGITFVSMLGCLWYRADEFWILISAMVPYSLTFYLSQFEQRYRYPVLWISVLLAAVGAQIAFQRLKRRSSR